MPSTILQNFNFKYN
uniref:Uncharacterized protein n=1 Tax=Arundo donax TaxID=35708 RepID=A0A0A9H2J0_ARUDO